MRALSRLLKSLPIVLLLAPALAHAFPSYTFENAKLGQGFKDEFTQKISLVPPCDIDSINGGSRSVAFFTAKPCRGPGMTEQTTIVVFTSPAITEQTRNPPVTALAWMGGTFLNTRSDFPVHVGTTGEEASQILGRPLQTVAFEDEQRVMRVRKHTGDTYSLEVDGSIVGFVVGEMPPMILESEEFEEWGALFESWFKFTAPYQSAPPSNPNEPGQPTQPGNPAIVENLAQFMSVLRTPMNEKLRFQALLPLLHPSLIWKDRTDFAPGVREYAYRRALKNVVFYEDPIALERVQVGQPTVIGSGPSAEEGQIDKYFLKRTLSAGGGSEPIHVFIPASGGSPLILNFGSL